MAARLGVPEVHGFLHALSGLSRHAEDAFPRELIPLILKQSARALLAAQVFHSGPHWLWPYWVTRQLDPHDPAYLPRAMSPLWHNLTHRNWTAIGVPGSPREAVVDPRGLVMPQHGGFSVDIAVLLPDGEEVAPAELREGYEQRMARLMPLVQGRFRAGPLLVTSQAWADVLEGVEVVRLTVQLLALVDVPDARFVLSLRPYNPEGPALVHRIDSVDFGWLVEGKPAVVLCQPAAERSLSSFWRGDAITAHRSDEVTVFCPAGLASAAAFYPVCLPRGQRLRLEFFSPMDRTRSNEASLRRLWHRGRPCSPAAARPTTSLRSQWRERRRGAARILLPVPSQQRVFDQAHQTLLVLDDGDCIRPGPLTYHQHWFRDSAYLVSALARLGHEASARRKLQNYRARQDRDGFFRSQAGEWDSCGQAIWTLVEHGRLFDDVELLGENWNAIAKGAQWIVRKRRTGHRPAGARGLFPPGLSAEHLGPPDHYFWDDLWGIGGLEAAAWAARRLGRGDDAARLAHEAAAFLEDVDAALAYARSHNGRWAMPAAPHRRFDAGMIGNLVGVYPLGIFDPHDERISDTLRVLETHFFVEDTFLQAMVHSGFNPYLTLHCAQVHLARRESDEAWRLWERICELATPTGTWPEAIHPRTLGGCMGDGCHGWSAAEFVLFVRNALAIDDEDHIIITPVMARSWGEGVTAEHLPTRFGPLSLWLEGDGERRLRLRMHLAARRSPRSVQWHLPRRAACVRVDGVIEPRLRQSLVVTCAADARLIEVELEDSLQA